MDFIFRHPLFSVSNVKRTWAIRKAMKEYAKTHPVCEATGVSGIEVHHVKPVELFPELAADPANFISLGKRDIHRIIGHGGDWKSYVENVREVAALMKVIRPEKKPPVG